MSAEASDMSSWLLMGLPGVAYISGIADPAWTAIRLAVGTYLNWLLVAKRLRNYSQACGNSITIPDFFTNRYRDDKNVLMLISAVIILIFFIPYTASGFSVCGKLFSTLFGMDYHAAMIMSAIIIIAYTSLGGFLAASTTDLIQSIIMTIALIVILFFGINTAGGWTSVVDNAKNLEGYFSMTTMHDAATQTGSNYGFITIISTMAWGLGYCGMPHILLRFMAIEDSNKLKTSRRIASVWVVISMAIAVIIGVVGLAVSKTGQIPVLEGTSSETIIVVLADLLSKNEIFATIMAGLILSGILASTMSTADSQLLAASSSMSQNILGSVFNVKADDKKSMLFARLTLVIIALIGVIIAWDQNSSVFGIVSFAWAGFGATFGPIMLAALFWKRSNKQGEIAGLVTGAIVIFVWKYVIRPIGGVWNIYELLPAFICACIAIVVVSLLTAPPSDEITAEFDAVKTME